MKNRINKMAAFQEKQTESNRRTNIISTMTFSQRILHVFLLISILPTLTLSQDRRLPPKILPASTIPGKYFKTKSTMKLPCEAEGIPTPSYVWKFNGADLATDGSIKQVGGDLLIDSFQESHQGYYQCHAVNKYGTSLSTVFDIQMAEIYFSTGNEINDYFKAVGDFLEVPLRGQFKSVPEPSFTWKSITDVNDPNPIPLNLNDSRVMITKEGALFFTYLIKEDAKLMKLTAFNNIVDQQIGGSYSRVIVRDGAPVPRIPSPVYPTSSNADVVVVEGEDLQLQCIFRGYPRVVVTWKGPNGNTLASHEHNATLIVRKVTRNEEGTYVCTGSNTEGDGQNYIKVDVQSRPKFAEGGKPMGVTETEGEIATFKCQTTKDTEPPADVSWLFNGEPVDVTKPGTRTSFTEKNTVLTIVGLKRDEDIRVIQCNSSNVHGYVFTDALLNVLVRTTITKPPQSQVLHVNMTRVHFDCQVDSDPLYPLTITWTKGDKLVADYNDPNMVIGNDGRQLNIILEKVGEDERLRYTGRYACNATNGFSYQRAEAELESYVDPGTGAVTAAAFPFWIIILLAVLGGLLFLLILIFSCCIYIQRNKGDAYLVDDLERKQGNDPEKELDNMGFHDYQRPEEGVGMIKESQASLAGSIHYGSEGGDSLAEYGDDFGKFTEDGSFIGLYMDEPRKQIKVSSA